MNDIHFAQKLKKARSDLAITQQELADKLHVSRKTVSGWETGRTRPDIDMLRQIAELCHISLDELVYDAKAPEHQDAMTNNSSHFVNRLTRTLLDIILAILIIERLTQDSQHHEVLTLMGWLIIFAIILRGLYSHWALKMIKSLRSPLFLTGYFLFVGIILYVAFIDLFQMGFVFQFILIVIGGIGLLNLVIIFIHSLTIHGLKHPKK